VHPSDHHEAPEIFAREKYHELTVSCENPALSIVRYTVPATQGYPHRIYINGPLRATRRHIVIAILCVDSNTISLHALSLIIRSSGYICIPASTTEDAVRAFSASHADLVILNNEPERTSLAAKLERLRDVPTIMLTDSVERTPKPSGVDILSPKPVHARELLSTISVLLADSLKQGPLPKVA
jgi:CheY-like chemotaxis protein